MPNIASIVDAATKIDLKTFGVGDVVMNSHATMFWVTATTRECGSRKIELTPMSDSQRGKRVVYVRSGLIMDHPEDWMEIHDFKGRSTRFYRPLMRHLPANLKAQARALRATKGSKKKTAETPIPV